MKKHDALNPRDLTFATELELTQFLADSGELDDMCTFSGQRNTGDLDDDNSSEDSDECAPHQRCVQMRTATPEPGPIPAPARVAQCLWQARLSADG